MENEDQQQAKEESLELAQIADESNQNNNDDELKTPTKIHMIPKDDSFKTCKTELPSTRRQLRMTPARNSILSGGTPFKEAPSTGKKFNSRRKVARAAQTSKLNDTGGSNETFVRHEQDLLFDRDSLDTHPPSVVRRHRISSTPKPLERIELASIAKSKPEPVPKPKPLESKFKAPAMRPPKPRVQTQQNIQQKPFNRFVTPRHFNVSNRYPESAKSSIFKRSMNTTVLNRSQSFKSTAELEKEYFSSLRSRI